MTRQERAVDGCKGLRAPEIRRLPLAQVRLPHVHLKVSRSDLRAPRAHMEARLGGVVSDHCDRWAVRTVKGL